jgi:hypothetical protein
MVSWIGFEDKLLYMDNASLRDSYARKLIEETGRKEDVVGHGFIRKYYNIPEGKGREFEVNEFWNYEKLPEEISMKLQNGEMDDLLEYVSNINLCDIIILAPDSWKVKAWEIFSKNNPSNIYLRCIIRYAPESWKEKASEILLRNNPSNLELRYIICYAPDSWKVKAQKLLDERNK